MLWYLLFQSNGYHNAIDTLSIPLPYHLSSSLPPSDILLLNQKHHIYTLMVIRNADI